MDLIVRSLPGLNPSPLERAEEAARRLLADADKAEAEVSLLFVDDAAIRELNRTWRGIDTATDVLSWPQDEENGPGALLLGDVAISLDTAARQAQARGWEATEEIALLLVHGILHLLGHEDETDEGAEGMRRIETELLGKPLDKVGAYSAESESINNVANSVE